MSTYKVKLVSQPHAIALLLILITVLFVEAWAFFPTHNTILWIFILAGHFGLAMFLWQKYVTGRTEWQIDDKRVIITFTKKFAFHIGRPYEFEWDDIEKIWQGRDGNYYNLKIRLTSGETINFFHDTLTTRDEFEEMLKTLYKKFYEVKKARELPITSPH